MNPREKMQALLAMRAYNEKLQMISTGFVLKALENAWYYDNTAIYEYQRTQEFQGHVIGDSAALPENITLDTLGGSK